MTKAKRTISETAPKVRGQAGHIAGKEKRRAKIMEAARAIITEEGDAGLTMRAIAARAEVSVVTPYNLFGSKQAVLGAIYREDFEKFRALYEASPRKDKLRFLFDLIDVNIEHWSTDPRYYRALSAILYYNAAPEVNAEVWGPRIAYVQSLVADAVTAGDLTEDTPVDAVARALVSVFRAATQDWVEDVITLERARDEIGAGFALVLGSLVTDKGQPSLKKAKARYDFSGRPATAD